MEALGEFSLYGQWQCLTQSNDALFDVQDHKFRRWCRIVSRTAHKEPRIHQQSKSRKSVQSVHPDIVWTKSVSPYWFKFNNQRLCLDKVSFPVLNRSQQSDFILDFNTVLTLGFCHGSAPTLGRHPWSPLFTVGSTQEETMTMQHLQ